MDVEFELSQRFFFDAAHTLRREYETAGSLRVHGHTYQAEVSVRGPRQADSGMVIDLAVLRAGVEAVRQTLDHHLLDEVPGLGAPTLENLCTYIATALRDRGLPLSAVRVWREASGDSCRLLLAR
ncbi:6-pyruvoyl tetrahydropterin synthase family protein [Xenophilus aerolatus]|nr:6-carboxytetrahydropterin synthase [Xenophilus aerolatus]